MDSKSQDRGRSSSGGTGPKDTSEGEGGEDGPIASFLKTYDRRRTREAYGHDLRDFFGVEEITPNDAEAQGEEAVRTYLEEAKETAGPTAAGRRRAALRAFYRWARREGIVSKETASEVRSAAVPASDQEEGE